MNRRGLQYLGVLSAGLVIAYIVISMMINFEGLYTKFRQHISDIGYDSKVSSIDVSHFPTPTVVLGGVEIPGIFSAKKLYLKFSVFSILTLNPSISSIEAEDVHIHTSGANMMHHESAVIRMFQLFPHLPNIDFKHITLDDRMAGTSEDVKTIKIRPNSSFNNITIYWTDKNYTNISYNKKDRLEVKIITVSPSHKIDFLETYDENLKLVSGTIDYHINNLRDHISSNYRDLDLLITQIASTEPMHMTCNFGIDHGGMLVRNINLKSESISMTGEADFFDGTKQDRLNLHFDIIDLTKLLKSPDMASIQLSKSKEELKLQNLNGIINVTVDNIKLSNFDIANVSLKGASDGLKLNIEEFVGLIDKDGKFNVSGFVTQNKYRSKFDGNLEVDYPDANALMSKLGYPISTNAVKSPLMIKSDIVATPIDYKLTNLYTTIGQVTSNGSASIKLIGATPRLALALNFSAIDFSNVQYPILVPVVNYFKSLANDMHDKEYLSKYIPLRKIGYIGNFDFIFNNPVISGEVVDKVHFICDAFDGMLNFGSLYYQNGKNYLMGNGKLAASGLKPLVTLRITDGEFSTNSLALGNILENLSKASVEYGFDKVTLDLAMTLKSLTQGGANFKNFYIASSNDGNLFNISGLQGIYNNGNFTSSGSMLLDSMTLSLAYAYSNFNSNDLDQIYPLSVFGIRDGWFSTNGTISANGNNVAQFIYSLYNKSEFVGSTVSWYGFDFDGFVDLINVKDYDKTNMLVDAKKFTSSGITNIPKISGSYEVDHGIIKFTDVQYGTKHTSCSAVATYNIYTDAVDVTTSVIFQPTIMDRNRAPAPIEIVLHTSGNIAAPVKEVSVGIARQQQHLKRIGDIHKNNN